MQAIKDRHIASGKQHDSLFPKPLGEDKVISSNASVWDTIEFMPKAAIMTPADTIKIARKLDSGNLYDTCENIWNFVYKHIQYKPDRFGVEQVRRPARLWAERLTGGDCDCYSVFISSILSNLQIPHTYRVTKYPKKDGSNPTWQHVYIIVPDGKDYITIDCVADQFDFEVPYLEKTDKPMELHYLNGFDIEEELLAETEMTADGIDADDLLEGSEDLGLLRIGKKHAAAREAARKKRELERQRRGGSRLKVGLKKVGKVAGKGLHIVNRINPAAALLRAGFLASMKLNLMRVAGILRYAYLTPAQARKQGIDMAKFPKLQKIRLRAEQIFHKAGGKPKNLKAAILKGKGNRNKQVPLNGLGYIDELDYHENTPLSVILGNDMYMNEVATDELNGLGEVATGTAIAAASTAMGALASLLKSIGQLFKKKATDPDSSTNPEAPLDEKQFIPEDYEGDDYSFTDDAEMDFDMDDSAFLPDSHQVRPSGSDVVRVKLADPNDPNATDIIDEPTTDSTDVTTTDTTTTELNPDGTPKVADEPSFVDSQIALIKEKPIVGVGYGLGALGLIGGAIWGLKTLFAKKAAPVNGLPKKKRKYKKRKSSPASSKKSRTRKPKVELL